MKLNNSNTSSIEIYFSNINVADLTHLKEAVSHSQVLVMKQEKEIEQQTVQVYQSIANC